MTTPRAGKSRSPAVGGCRARRLRIALLATAAALSGCSGDGGGTYRVRGTVTFDSSPVPVGTIFFHPDASAGNDGPSGFAQIVDGRYDSAVGRGRGVIPGPHRVVIIGHKRPAAGASPENGVEMLFHEYRTRVTLPAAGSHQDFDVPK